MTPAPSKHERRSHEATHATVQKKRITQVIELPPTLSDKVDTQRDQRNAHKRINERSNESIRNDYIDACWKGTLQLTQKPLQTVF
eukprot:3435252-Amphidinium_carterae.1